MNTPEDLKYTPEHEWTRIEGDIATVGVTDYAQGELGDIVFLELPEVGSKADKDEVFGTIEAVKAVSDLYSPLSGEILEVNSSLEESPDLVNSDPYGNGWMVKIKISNMQEVDNLLSSDAYNELT